MAALIDYLAWRGDLEFCAVPPNEVDSLIFSQIIYIGTTTRTPTPAKWFAPLSTLLSFSNLQTE